MVGVVGAFTFVQPAALVYAADIFAQTVQDILRVHGIGKAVRLLAQMRNDFRHRQKRTHNALGIKRMSVLLFINHGSTPPV